MLCAVVSAAVLLPACASSPRFVAEHPPPRAKPAAPDNGASVRPGKSLLTLEGIASYYAEDFHGKQTSNGEIYNMHDLTAAHRTLPFGTRIRVTNLANNLQVVVRVNDRGPYVEGRLIDLSLAGAQKLDMIKTGTAMVRLEVLSWGTGE
jgi:rare lipoprotein A